MPLSASRFDEIQNTLRLSQARDAIEFSEEPTKALNQINPDLHATEAEIIEFCAEAFDRLPQATT